MARLDRDKGSDRLSVVFHWNETQDELRKDDEYATKYRNVERTRDQSPVNGQAIV
jgi:hypothetical protein